MKAPRTFLSVYRPAIGPAHIGTYALRVSGLAVTPNRAGQGLASALHLHVGFMSARRDEWRRSWLGQCQFTSMSMGLAFLMGTWRMLAYAGVLAAGGVLTVWAEAGPGWPMLAAGVVITITGTVMLARFLRSNPVVETA